MKRGRCMARTTIRSAGRLKRTKPVPDGFVRQLGEGHWEIRINRKLPSANATMWAHWRVKKREREDWEAALNGAAQAYAGVTTNAGLQLVKRSLSLFLNPGEKVRRRVVVSRFVKHRREFCRDDMNLDFSHKHLVDAMKLIGMLYDDNRKWADIPKPTEAVSPDGQAWTVIEIQTVPMAVTQPAARPAAAGGVE